MVENKMQPQDVLFKQESIYPEFGMQRPGYSVRPWEHQEFVSSSLPYDNVLQRKRKSLDWDLKYNKKNSTLSNKKRLLKKDSKMNLLYTSNTSDLNIDSNVESKIKEELMIGEPREPLPFIPEVLSTVNEVPWYEEDIDLLADLFISDTQEIKPVNTLLLKSRKSEDWDTKPKAVQFRKRAKWSEAEMRQLWECISKHGNNWTIIRDLFATRSYCQIKDKGRRCLFSLGWSTGRSKCETDESNLRAKKIADQVLSRMN